MLLFLFLHLDPVYIWLYFSLRILFIFRATVNGITSVTLTSSCLLLVYKKEIDFYTLTLYLEISGFLYLLISSRKVFAFLCLVNLFQIFYIDNHVIYE